jgi:hypothetical protein
MKTAKGKILGGARPGSGRKPRTEDKKTVSAYLKPELHRRLRDAAKAEGKSSSALITEAIEKYLNYQRFFKKLAKRPPKFRRAIDFCSIVYKQGGFSLNGNVLTVNTIKKRFKIRDLIGLSE